MDSRSKVLLLDDGDLFRIERMLRDFEVDLEHLRGDVIREDLEGSPDVVIATVKRCRASPSGSPFTARTSFRSASGCASSASTSWSNRASARRRCACCWRTPSTAAPSGATS
jgi:hypothetical protein